MREDEVHDDSEAHGGHDEHDDGLEEQKEHGTAPSRARARAQTNDSRQRTAVVIARQYLRVQSCCAVQQHLRYLIAQ